MPPAPGETHEVGSRRGFIGSTLLTRAQHCVLQCGAFDTAHLVAKASRAQAYEAIEPAIERGKRWLLGGETVAATTELHSQLLKAATSD